MISDWLQKFESEVTSDWSHLATSTTTTGTRCVGKVPHIGSAAWLHRFWSGCSPDLLTQFEDRTGIQIPALWQEVLLTMNGISLFVGQVNLRGVLRDGLLTRSIDDPQPLSLENANTVERPRGRSVRSEDFVVGASSVGEGACFVLRLDGTIAKLNRSGDAELASWATLQELLGTEYATLNLDPPVK